LPDVAELVAERPASRKPLRAAAGGAGRRDTSRELTATRAHLEDMRTLVLKKPA
jgi:hypothetical protein